MTTNAFDIGDRVRKVTGDYDFDGTVQTYFDKRDGQTRLVVEDDRGALHIYNEKNLAPIGNAADHQYLKVLNKLLNQGVYRKGRNGSTRGLFGEQMRFDLSEGFPLLTTKKVHFRSLMVELLWFLRGDTNIRFLHDHKVSIWDEWADPDGELGPVYGRQWRSWPAVVQKMSGPCTIGIDQISGLIENLKRDPCSRRHVVSAWNPAEVGNMALPPCHCLFQFHVASGKLSCHLYQRSADWFLGVPFNVASYALLTHLIAAEVGLEAGDLVHSFGELHLYENHVSQARLQLKRQPLSLPRLWIADKPIFDLTPEDIGIDGYDPHPAIPAPVSR